MVKNMLPDTAILIVAAGVGERLGGGIPKQYRPLGRIPVIRRTIQAMLAAKAGPLWVVIHPDHRALYEQAGGDLPVAGVIEGGATRQESVRNGLRALAGNPPRHILIHDAARPFISAALVARLLGELAQGAAGIIPALPVTETLKRVERNQVNTTIPRETTVAAQTPQAFDYALLSAAHTAYAGQGLSDDAALMENAGHTVRWIAGERENIKLTTAEDWAMAEKIAAGGEVRTGFGYDVHRLIPSSGGMIRLGGVDIPHTHRLEGHSDADVLLHALVDAMLGALGEGDIGQHFPPSEARWKGVDSAVFVAEACRLMAIKQAQLLHADLTIICEAPKIGPHREAMRARVAHLLGAEENRINIKATTTEGLGFAGRREGIAAQAVVTLRAYYS